MALYPHLKGGYWEYGTAGYPIVGGLAENVLDDFEDNSLSEYGGARSKFETQNQDVIKGRYTLKGTSGSGAVIGDNGGDIPTSRTSSPTEYRCRMYLDGGGGGTLLTNVQSESSPWTNCYGLVINADFDEIGLFKRESGSTDYFEIKTLRIDANKEYWPFITLTDEGINGGLRDSNGNELTRTESYRDLTFSGGGLGWRVYSDPPILFDHATYHAGSMDDVSRVIIDDYEDGNLAEYTWPSSSGYQETSPASAYAGDYGLELVNYSQVFTKPGWGLENYPRDGKKFKAYMRFLNNGSSQYWIYLCPQETDDANGDGYTFEVHMGSDYGRIQKDRGHHDIPGEGTGSSDTPEMYDINWKTDTWYRVEILLDSSDGIFVEVYEAATNDYVGYVETYDTQYIQSTNGFGFRCGDDGHLYADAVEEITQ